MAPRKPPRRTRERILEVSLALAPDHKPIRFLFLPEGEDPDTYVRKHGKEAFEARVGAAETLSQFLLAQLRSENDLATAEGRARFVSMAKHHIQKITAPALRLQLINEIAQLARVGEGEIHGLLELPQRPRFSRPAPRRPSGEAPSSLEWSLLTALLSDLTLVEHIEGSRLTEDWYRVYGGEQAEGAIIVSQIDAPVHYSTLLSGRVANVVPVDTIDLLETVSRSRDPVRRLHAGISLGASVKDLGGSKATPAAEREQLAACLRAVASLLRDAGVIASGADARVRIASPERATRTKTW